MSMAWEPDRRYNFFFSPPAHLCAVTCMTEISLIVTLNNQFNQSINLIKDNFILVPYTSYIRVLEYFFFESTVNSNLIQ